jgi:deazaflavin-dependent oxidoreductase (nitroreductase family)
MQAQANGDNRDICIHPRRVVSIGIESRENTRLNAHGGGTLNMNDLNSGTIETFRANHGQPGGFWEGRPLLLLTTTGAKSGQLRTTPVMYLREGDRIFIFASKGGAPTNPDWYYNLVAHPEVTVEIGDQTYHALARTVTGAEHDSIYTRWAEMYPQYREYQEKTSRSIPVIEVLRQTA